MAGRTVQEILVLFCLFAMALTSMNYDRGQKEAVQRMQEEKNPSWLLEPIAQIGQSWQPGQSSRNCEFLKSMKKRSLKRRMMPYEERIIDVGPVDTGRISALGPCIDPSVIQRPQQTGSSGGMGLYESLRQKVLESSLSATLQSSSKSTSASTTPIKTRTTMTITRTRIRGNKLTSTPTNSDNKPKQPIRTVNPTTKIQTSEPKRTPLIQLLSKDGTTRLPSIRRSIQTQQSIGSIKITSLRYEITTPNNMISVTEMAKQTTPTDKNTPKTKQSALGTTEIKTTKSIVVPVSADTGALHSTQLGKSENRETTVETNGKYRVKYDQMTPKSYSYTSEKGILKTSPTSSMSREKDNEFLRSFNQLSDTKQKLQDAGNEGTEMLAAVISVSVLVMFVGSIIALLVYRKKQHRKIQDIPPKQNNTVNYTSDS